MKLWKRVIPFGLAAVMTAAGPAAVFAASPDFAKTEEEWARLRDNVLEYDEIADLIHEYNTTVAANNIAYQKTRNKTVDDISQQYWDAAANAGRAAWDADSKAEAATYLIEERSAEINADDNVDDGENDRLTYAKAEAGLVKQAQQLMNTYNQLLIQRELQDRAKQEAELQLNAATVKLGQGMSTNSEVLLAQQTVQTCDANIISLDAQIIDTKQNLAIMTGWKQDSNPEVKGIPEVDYDRLSTIDLAADTEKALQNDYSLQIEKRRLQHSATEENKTLYSNNVKKLEQSVKSSVDLGYQSVLLAYTAYEQAQLDHTLANNNMNTAQRQYQLGIMSQSDYSNLEYLQQTSRTSLELKKMELFQAVQNYDWILNGLASS